MLYHCYEEGLPTTTLVNMDTYNIHTNNKFNNDYKFIIIQI